MKVKPNLTATETRERAQAWYDKQLGILKQCHGPRWPDHEPWVSEYLKAELRTRLLALGWVPKR